jgi:hypothetical protein
MLDVMSDRKLPSKSTGRTVTEAEVDARTPEQERHRWQNKMFFATSKITPEGITEAIIDRAANEEKQKKQGP